MNKIITIIVVAIIFSACSQESAEKSVDQSEMKPKKEDKALQGYQDNIKRAKELEKEMLEHAEKQKKAIDKASGNN